MTNPQEPQVLTEVKQYRFIRQLGKGGMGTVYEATDTRDGGRVAVKLLHPWLVAEDMSFRDRFEREAHIAALLRSPYSVRLLDFGVANATYFLVMEFVEGTTVGKELESGPLEPLRALRIAIDVARALEEAAARGVVHRDIKPDNILLTADGRVKVTDFGIARQEGGTGLTSAGRFVGTAEFAAPEQAVGDADHRTDIYALGATLYCMLAGRPPFQSASVWDLLKMHQSTQVPMEPLAHLPDNICNPIRRALEKDPRDRYQTASEFAGALERAMAGYLHATEGGKTPSRPPVPAPTPPPPAATPPPAGATHVYTPPAPQPDADATRVATPAGPQATRVAAPPPDGATRVAAVPPLAVPPAPSAGTSSIPPTGATRGPFGGPQPVLPVPRPRAKKRGGTPWALIAVGGAVVGGGAAAAFLLMGGGSDDGPGQGTPGATATAMASQTGTAASTPATAGGTTAPAGAATTAPTGATTSARTIKVLDRWEYAFTISANGCAFGAAPGTKYAVAFRFRPESGSATAIKDGDRVSVTGLLDREYPLGVFPFAYDGFEFTYPVQGAAGQTGTARVRTVFASDSAIASATLNEQYANPACTITGTR